MPAPASIAATPKAPTAALNAIKATTPAPNINAPTPVIITVPSAMIARVSAPIAAIPLSISPKEISAKFWNALDTIHVAAPKANKAAAPIVTCPAIFPIAIAAIAKAPNPTMPFIIPPQSNSAKFWNALEVIHSAAPSASIVVIPPLDSPMAEVALLKANKATVP